MNTIQVAGFDINCTASESAYSLPSGDDFNSCREQSNFNLDCSISEEVFRVAIDYNQFPRCGAGHHISFITRFKDTPSHAGRLNQRNCTLREAVVDYSLKIVNDTVNLLPRDESFNTTEYVMVREVERSGMASGPSTCGGLWRALHDKYPAAASISYTRPSYAVRTNDSTARQYLIANGEGNSTCRDPMPDMLAIARELSLSMAIMATPKYP
jgi:hypothetical protein